MATFSIESIQERADKTRAIVEDTSKRRERVNKHLEEILRDEPLQEVAFAGAEEDFESAKAGVKALEQNIVMMIAGMQNVTDEIGAEFASLSAPTLGERMVGVFSKRRAAAMQEDRIRGTTINDHLQNLMIRSEEIATELETQRAVMSDELDATVEQQSLVEERRVQLARELSDVGQRKTELQTEIEALDAKYAATSDAVERQEIEAERKRLANTFNETASREQEVVALQQSLERFSSQFATYAESLQSQVSNQNVLIAKLRSDTEQRRVLYSALTESIKTASMQNAASKLDSMATELDAQGEMTMAKLGAAARSDIITLGDRHQQYMQRTEALRKQSDASTRAFQERYAEILDRARGEAA